jgi:hypothetical protein
VRCTCVHTAPVRCPHGVLATGMNQFGDILFIPWSHSPYELRTSRFSAEILQNRTESVRTSLTLASIVRTSQVPRPVSVVSYGHRTLTVRPPCDSRASTGKLLRDSRCSKSARTSCDARTSYAGALAVPVRGPCELLTTSKISTSSATARELGETFSPSPRVFYEFKKSVRCSQESTMFVRTPCDFAKFRLKTYSYGARSVNVTRV